MNKRNLFRLSSFVIFFVSFGVFIYTLVYCLRDAEGASHSGDTVSGSSISTAEATLVEEVEEDEQKDTKEKSESNDEENNEKMTSDVEIEVSEEKESETSVPYGESIDDYSEEEQELLLNAVGIDVFDSALGTIRLEGDDIIRVESASEYLESYVGPVEWLGDSKFTYGSGEGKVSGFYDLEEDSMVVEGIYFRRRR